MTSLIFLIYLIDVLDTLDKCAIMFTVLTTISSIILSVSSLMNYDYKDKPHTDYYHHFNLSTKYLKKSFICLGVSVLCLVLIPNKKTLIIMGGLHAGNLVITEMSKSPLVQKTYQLLEKEINNALELQNE